MKRSARKHADLSRARGPVRLEKTHAHGPSTAEEPTEEVIREMLLAGFDQAFGIQIDDLYPPSTVAEPSEEHFREMLLAGFEAIRGMEIDDVFPANSTADRATPDEPSGILPGGTT